VIKAHQRGEVAGQLSLLRKLRIIADTVAALAFMHDRRGHVHRDLKPNNILITRK